MKISFFNFFRKAVNLIQTAIKEFSLTSNLLRTTFYPRTKKFGGYSDEPGIRPSAHKHFRVRSIP